MIAWVDFELCSFLFRYEVQKDRPVLAKYMADIRSELNPHYDEVHTTLNQLKTRFPNGEIPGLLGIARWQLSEQMESWFKK